MQADLLGGSPPPHDHGCKVRIKVPSSWLVEATFDGPGDCYRYRLSHRWGPGPRAMIIMKNPSGADEWSGDQTVMKTARIFQRLGFGGQYVGNTCAYRHVDPKALLTVDDPVGPGNHAALLAMAADSRTIVVAHGQLPKRLQGHADAVCRLLIGAGHRLHVLRLSAQGIPMHPLVRGKMQIPITTDPVPWLGPTPGG